MIRVRPGLLALAALVVASAASGGGLDVTIDAYRAAATDGATGTVTGRAIDESDRRSAPDEPRVGIGVTLVPRSRALLEELGGIKRRVRSQPTTYPTSARAVVEARRNYERALATAGAGDLVRYVPGSADGTFQLEHVPIGEWVLLVEHAVFVNKPGPIQGRQEWTTFRKEPQFLGYYAVTFWLEELRVARGETAAVELTERNAWMTGIEEQRTPEPKPPRRPR
ncbi:MAG: hypothetical protein DMD91_07185 [Candidatus Rokuibacteriota bacterium]|nr:MAG: hypothetical protein DMD91_07185 [Candidatus Rokubacteria bacterium]